MPPKSAIPKTRREQQHHPDPLLNDVRAVVIEQQRHGEGRPKFGQIKTPPPLIRESVGVTISSHGVPRQVASYYGDH